LFEPARFFLLFDELPSSELPSALLSYPLFLFYLFRHHHSYLIRFNTRRNGSDEIKKSGIKINGYAASSLSIFRASTV